MIIDTDFYVLGHVIGFSFSVKSVAVQIFVRNFPCLDFVGLREVWQCGILI